MLLPLALASSTPVKAYCVLAVIIDVNTEKLKVFIEKKFQCVMEQDYNMSGITLFAYQQLLGEHCILASCSVKF